MAPIGSISTRARSRSWTRRSSPRRSCARRRSGNRSATSTRTRLLDAFRSARVILPGFNNWLLFAATVEAFLKQAGDPTWDRMRIDYALRQHEQWYKGDGIYGDGPQFHFDYYNAFVIQPMLVDVLDACADDRPAWQAMREPVLTRARRYAAIQERLDRARRLVSAGRPVPRLPLRRVPGAGARGAASRPAGRRARQGRREPRSAP